MMVVLALACDVVSGCIALDYVKPIERKSFRSSYSRRHNVLYPPTDEKCWVKQCSVQATDVKIQAMIREEFHSVLLLTMYSMFPVNWLNQPYTCESSETIWNAYQCSKSSMRDE